MNGLEEYYVIRNHKKLRFGYTTGSCAAGAAKGAAWMLLRQTPLLQVELLTPKGIRLYLRLEDISIKKDRASCCVTKDGGDDPDTTNGLKIYALVEKTPQKGISIDGGKGVGRITKPGLEQPVGSAAINQVPRAMIQKELEALCASFSYDGGLRVTIYSPDGEDVAKKTFNPRLGILGGISILGTTGIVEPMSEAAYLRSLEVEMKQRIIQGEKYLLITPGNYGADYLRSHTTLPPEQNFKCGNYIGETIDMAVSLGAKGILFVAHIGKFIKVAGGIMNTHSHSADARMELLSSNALRAGADLATAREILSMTTTEEALNLLKERGLLDAVMKEVTERIQFYLDHRSYEQILLGAVIFSSVHGYLGETKNARQLMKYLEPSKKGETVPNP